MLSPEETVETKAYEVELVIDSNLMREFEGTNSVTMVLGDGVCVEQAVNRFRKCGWYVKKQGAKYEFAPMVDCKGETP